MVVLSFVQLMIDLANALEINYSFKMTAKCTLMCVLVKFIEIKFVKFKVLRLTVQRIIIDYFISYSVPYI